MDLRWVKLHPFDQFASRLFEHGPEGRRLVGEVVRYGTCGHEDHDGVVFHAFLCGDVEPGTLGCWPDVEDAQSAVEDAHRGR